jgi:hypothetical protein
MIKKEVIKKAFSILPVECYMPLVESLKDYSREHIGVRKFIRYMLELKDEKQKKMLLNIQKGESPNES